MMRIHRPWRDHRGRLVPIKALALALLAIPAALLALDAWRGELGPRPWNAAIHDSGFWAECLVLTTLALTPLRVVLDWPRLAFIRRIVGVGALAYVGLHLTLYTIDLKFAWAQIFWEAFTRFYLIIGLIGALGLFTLGLTSFDAAMRRMGPGWKRLHRLAYPIAMLTTVHYMLQTKADIGAPALAFGVLAWLLAWRGLARVAGEKRARGFLALFGLGLFAALFTAAAEAAWYRFGTGIDWRRVLAANLDQWEYLRPSGQTALLAAGLLVLAIVRRALRGRISWPVGWRLPSLPSRAPSR